MTDIGFRTRCFRKSKRHDLLQGQWEDKRLAAHRQRIQNVAPRIDNDIPLSDSFMHVKVVCTNAHTTTIHMSPFLIALANTKVIV